MDPLVSIIIVNYNGKRYLKDCFESLERGEYKNFEIIFVDNGSEDGSVDYVRSNFPHVRIIDNNENLGLAVASNRGAAVAGGKYLFFFNNDTKADPRMLSELVKRAESDPSIGICGCKTLTYDGSSVINCGVACDIYGYPFGEGEPLYVDAAIFIRRDVFDEIGGFDPELFLYGEDRDICWRCLIYGYDVVVVPTAVFYHDSFCSIKKGEYSTNTFRRHVGERNMIRTMLKNYSLLNLIHIAPRYLFINFAEIMVFTLLGRFRVVGSCYLKAYWWNLIRLGDTLRHRRRIQSERKADDSVVLGRMGRKSGKLKLFRKIGIPRFSDV